MQGAEVYAGLLKESEMRLLKINDVYLREREIIAVRVDVCDVAIEYTGGTLYLSFIDPDECENWVEDFLSRAEIISMNTPPID